MRIPHACPITLIMFFFILFSFFSCSKDTDLLAEYVATDMHESRLISNIFIDDKYVINGNETIVLDVFSNDSIINPDKVRIVETSQPNYGTVTINENSSLTYTPSPSSSEEDTVDNFSYTTETEQENGTTSTEETTVVVTKINNEVKYWQRLFDDKWEANDRADALARSKSRNRSQEYYFLGYYIDGLSSLWQSTGDNSYLDEALSLIKNTMNDAISVGNGYKGWPSADNQEVGLWDSFYWRHVATLLRIMHQSPNLRASGYQSQYEELLNFSEKNIWNRYESNGIGNFYRSRTHMASHWARIGMELYIITGRDKYLEVFENISFKTMPNLPSNLRDQLYSNPKSKSGYAWDSRWGITNGSEIQDTSHGGAIIEFWVLAYENNMYWTKGDIDALIITLNEVIWPRPLKGNSYNVDGSGGYAREARLHEWLVLGRYDSEIQSKIKNGYKGKNRDNFGSQLFGIAALNAKILSESMAVYPEN